MGIENTKVEATLIVTLESIFLLIVESNQHAFALLYGFREFLVVVNDSTGVCFRRFVRVVTSEFLISHGLYVRLFSRSLMEIAKVLRTEDRRMVVIIAEADRI